MEKRDKAQDIFMKADHWLSQPTPFEKAFPTIEKLSVEVEEFTWSGKVYAI